MRVPLPSDCIMTISFGMLILRPLFRLGSHSGVEAGDNRHSPPVPSESSFSEIKIGSTR